MVLRFQASKRLGTAAIFLLTALAACHSPTKDSAGPVASAQTLAIVDGKPITMSDVRPATAFRIYQRRMDIYALLRAETETLVDERLLEREAKRQGISVDQLLAHEVDAADTAASDAEVDAYLQEHPEVAGVTESRTRVAHFLEARKKNQIRNALLEKLRAAASYRLLLHPPDQPRVQVELAGGPARGPADAPVTLVHFAAFDSVLSARSAADLRRLQKEFPTGVRLVYRNFVDENDALGLKAARIAAAADDDGRFWDLHDLLFALGGHLTDERLAAAAEKVGIDAARRAAILRDPRYRERVERDIAIGHEAGVTREPVVFVNRRYFSATLPYEQLHDVVASELASAK